MILMKSSSCVLLCLGVEKEGRVSSGVEDDKELPSFHIKDDGLIG